MSLVRRVRSLPPLSNMRGVACGCGGAVARLNNRITEMIRLGHDGITDREVWRMDLDDAEERIRDVEDRCGVDLSSRPFSVANRLGAERMGIERGDPPDEWNLLMMQVNLATGFEWCEMRSRDEEPPRR